MKPGVIALLLALALVSCLSGCTSAPPATVELSEIVEDQIREMQRSHEAFVNLYYDRLEDDIEEFLEEEWIPQFLTETMSGEDDESLRFLGLLDSTYKLQSIDPDAVTVQIEPGSLPDEQTEEVLRDAVQQAVEAQRARFGQLMIGYANSVQREINKRRKSMLDPVREQKKYILAELRDGYADIFQGSAAIRAHLASVVQLTSERDVILDKLGLLETQRALVNAAVRGSDDSMSLLAGAGDAQSAIDDFIERMTALKDNLFNLGAGGGGSPAVDVDEE